MIQKMCTYSARHIGIEIGNLNSYYIFFLWKSANVHGAITLDIDRSSMSTNATGCVGQERSVRWSTSCNFLLIHEFLNDIR